MVWGLELEKEMARASQRARAWGCAAGLPRVDIRAIQCTSCMSIVRDYKDEYWGTLGRVMGMGWQLVWAMVKDQARVRVSRWKKVRASRRLQHHGLPQQCECIPFELQLKIHSWSTPLAAWCAAHASSARHRAHLRAGCGRLLLCGTILSVPCCLQAVSPAASTARLMRPLHMHRAQDIKLWSRPCST